eukprot:jgi/Mesvir1/16421/Mv18150-RA.3
MADAGALGWLAGHLGIKHLFAASLKSFTMIALSEIGDKTFFIAAVLAMRNSRMRVFMGTIMAMLVMTVIAAGVGWAAPNLISKYWTHWGATVLFLVFGLKMLHEWATHNVEPFAQELQEVESELKDSMKKLRLPFHPIFIEAFTLTFLAEWGDRSQVATVGLATQEDFVGVTLGGMLGHVACTGVAVICGRHFAAKVSETMVHLLGGLLFLAFFAHSVYTGPEYEHEL